MSTHRSHACVQKPAPEKPAAPNAYRHPCSLTNVSYRRVTLPSGGAGDGAAAKEFADNQFISCLLADFCEVYDCDTSVLLGYC